MDLRSDFEADRRLGGSRAGCRPDLDRGGPARRRGGSWRHPADLAGRRQAGWVTAELAFALLAVAVAVVFLASLCALGLAQVRCSDTAAEIAREAARDDLARVAEIRQSLPEATITLEERDGLVVVHLVMLTRPWGSWLPTIQLTAEAQAWSERQR